MRTYKLSSKIISTLKNGKSNPKLKKKITSLKRKKVIQIKKILETKKK